MQDDPLLPDDPLSLAPFRSDSDDSLMSKEASVEKSGDTCSASTDIEEPCDGLIAANPSDASTYAAEELERILTDLSNNSFRQCVARVLGTEAVSEENYGEPQTASRQTIMEKPTSVDDELFLYDTSSSDEGSNLPPIKRTDVPTNLNSRDAYIAKLVPWKEIFPPLRVHLRIPQRSLYWISTALKHSARAVSGLTN